jgi:WD40 repeat protein
MLVALRTPASVLLAHPRRPLVLATRVQSLTNCAVWVLDLERDVFVHKLAGHTGFIRSLALDPGGTRLASGSCDGAPASAEGLALARV